MRSIMHVSRSLAVALLLTCLPEGRLRAEGHEAPVADPKILLKVIDALESSGLDDLTSRDHREGGVRATYHLKSADYLGTLTWQGETVVLATAFYIRSRLADRDTPPARGHFFLVCLDAKASKVVAHTRQDVVPYHLDGEVLKRGNLAIIDFGNHDDLTRYRGYLVDGALLPYPFKDRITEADWESGAFKKQP
ncbi:hypothetical protein [Verrucomicrobium sp. BvORR106]|uniref:hypothetical protein n=1 Tax=Verrucomicrobium sp. BvORR106 TaxID=1403819 RepID=UPI00056E3886|nr:hypothetical protein [Verrucomicrobium sp. BvORR106]